MVDQGDLDIWNSVWQKHWYSRETLRVRRSRQKVACVENILTRIGRVDSLSVCEIGCGSGYFLREVSCVLPSETTFYGCDQSSVAIEAAARTLSSIPKLHLFCGDAAATKFPEKTFHLIFAVCVLEHITRKRPVIEELVRIARPGSLVIVFYSSTRSAFFLEHVVKAKIGRWKFGYQDEKSISQVIDIFSPEFRIKKYGTLQGDWDFPLLRSIDSVFRCFLRNWGRYQYYVLEKTA